MLVCKFPQGFSYHRWFVYAPLLILLAIGFFAASCSREDASSKICRDTLGCVWIGPEEPVRIASLQTRSGDVRFVGLEYARGLEQALASRDGRLAGHPVNIVIENDYCSREGGLTAAQKLATDSQLLAVFGPTCSAAAVPAAEILSNAGLVLLSGSATAPSLTSSGGFPGAYRQVGFLRTAPNDDMQGYAAATFAWRDLGVHRAATINDGDPYTQGLARAFETAFEKLGGQIGLSGVINKGDVNMVPVMTAVAQSGSQLLFFPIMPPEGDHIVLAAADLPALQAVKLMSADGMLNQTFLERVGPAAEQMYFVKPVSPVSERYPLYLAQYQKLFGEVPRAPFHAHSYDAAELLLTALEQALFTEEDGFLRLERQTLRDTLYATRDFPGLTGNLSCDEWGDCGDPNFELLQLMDAAQGIEGLLQNVVFTY